MNKPADHSDAHVVTVASPLLEVREGFFFFVFTADDRRVLT